MFLLNSSAENGKFVYKVYKMTVRSLYVNGSVPVCKCAERIFTTSAHL